MKPQAIAITLTAASLLLLAARATERGNVEAGDGGAVFDLAAIIENLETMLNQTTQAASAATTPAPAPNVAAGNIAAFLAVIQQAEGTDKSGDPYRVCFGYGHTIRDLREHPAITGEWRGQRLSDTMCSNAGFGPGCVSTAAGAYQIIRPTWAKVRDRLSLPSFGANEQDAAAVELIRQRGALEDVRAGRFESAVEKCRNEWASLPGNFARQGQRSMGQLLAWYQQHGGHTA